MTELTQWSAQDGQVRLGAGVTYARVIEELGGLLPGLAMAARTVGSPQIRNRGTVGGNLGAASPAGDCHPPLLAAGAQVELASVRGTRVIPADDFYTGVKRNALAPDELIAAILIPPAAGPQQFSKIGTRNAMVIAVAAFSIGLDPRTQDRRDRHRVGGTDAAAGRRGGAVPGRRAGGGGPVGVARASCPSRSSGSSPSGSGPRRSRSTTCAAAPPTGGTRWPSWPGGP